MSDEARYLSLILAIVLAVFILLLLTVCSRDLISSTDRSSDDEGRAAERGDKIPLDASENERPALPSEAHSAEEG